jgi:hypothetical protein
MTELGDAGFIEPQILSLSAHETPAAAVLSFPRLRFQIVPDAADGPSQCDKSPTITKWHIDAGSGRRPSHPE